MPTASNTFALVVGVQDYDNYPAYPALGARNDVRRWVNLLHNHLGLSNDNIVVLSNPQDSTRDIERLTGHAMAEENVGLPTLSRIERELVRLGERVRANKSDGRDCNAIFVFAGHGTSLVAEADGQEGTTLALCPMDVGPLGDGPPRKLLTFEAVQALWTAGLGATRGANPATKDLTMILDSCYDFDGKGSRALPAQKHHPRPASRSLDAFERVLMAAQEGQTAKDVRIQQEWYGAFSFALTAMIEQWQIRSSRGVNSLTGSYGDVMYRVRELVQVLGVLSQTPGVSGFRGIEQVGMFNPSDEVIVGSTSPTPNSKHPTLQLSGNSNGFTSYAFFQGSWPANKPPGTDTNVIAVGVVAGKDSYGAYEDDFSAGVETWRVNTEDLDLSKGIQLRVSSNDSWPTTKFENGNIYQYFNNAALKDQTSFTVPESVVFNDIPEGEAPQAFCGQDPDDNAFGVVLTNTKVTWYRSESQLAVQPLLFSSISNSGESPDTVVLPSQTALFPYESLSDDVDDWVQSTLEES